MKNNLTNPKADVQRIIEKVAEHTGYAVEDIIGMRRHAHLARMRHVAMYLARVCTYATLEECGEVFGRRHYTSIIYGAQKGEHLCNEKFLSDLELEPITTNRSEFPNTLTTNNEKL